MSMYRRTAAVSLTAALLISGLSVVPAYADTALAVAIRGGTLGFGPEFDWSLSKSFALRVGYDAYSRHQTTTNTGATYDGSLKLANGSALVDWSPGGKFFHITAGGVATNTKIDVTGVPISGTVTLGNTAYPSSSISSVTGEVKMGRSLAPYVGLGFGNPVGTGSHLTFLFDVGAVITGTPDASLSVVCAAATPAATCTQIQQSAATEVTKLKSDTSNFKLWPVLNLGLAYRF